MGDNAGVTTLSTGKATYDSAIQKLTIPGINFNLSCPTGLRVSWTSGQPSAQTQQPAKAVGEPSPPCNVPQWLAAVPLTMQRASPVTPGSLHRSKRPLSSQAHPLRCLAGLSSFNLLGEEPS